MLKVLVALFLPLTVAGGKTGPCDIYGDAGTPCVAAHSTVRALYKNYTGPLYSIQRSSDNVTVDIGVLKSGGFANSAKQESFCGNYNDIKYVKVSDKLICESSSQMDSYCGGEDKNACGPNWGDLNKCEALCNSFLNCAYITYFADEGCRIYTDCKNPTQWTDNNVLTTIYQRRGNVCKIQKIYDQSPMKNHLTPAPAGGAAELQDVGTNAARDLITVGSPSTHNHNVYGAYFEGGMGFRNDKTAGVAVGDEEQTIYMVVSGTHVWNLLFKFYFQYFFIYLYIYHYPHINMYITYL